MRKPILAGNWKMYKTVIQSIELANSIKRASFEVEGADIVLCPPFTSLSDVNEILIDSNIALGAQDVYWESEGAFTGEVSCSMLKSAGCKYVIIGHSERRKLFGETNETVNKKLKAVLKEGLIPIVCVGEVLEERNQGRTFDVIRDHVENGLRDIPKDDAEKLIIAYEPVWAIGTGVNATAEQAQEVHKFIRGLLAKAFGEELAGVVRIQYGGSVKPENVEELISEEDVDGALVGGASLKADSFVEIVKISVKVKNRK